MPPQCVLCGRVLLSSLSRRRTPRRAQGGPAEGIPRSVPSCLADLKDLNEKGQQRRRFGFGFRSPGLTLSRADAAPTFPPRGGCAVDVLRAAGYYAGVRGRDSGARADTSDVRRLHARFTGIWNPT